MAVSTQHCSSYDQLQQLLLVISSYFVLVSQSLGAVQQPRYTRLSQFLHIFSYEFHPLLFDSYPFPFCIIARSFCLVFFSQHISFLAQHFLQSFLLLFISIFPLACQVSMLYYVSLFYFMLCYRWTFGIANCPMALLLIHCFCSYCL